MNLIAPLNVGETLIEYFQRLVSINSSLNCFEGIINYTYQIKYGSLKRNQLKEHEFIKEIRRFKRQK
jgi:hypothetical protein